MSSSNKGFGAALLAGAGPTPSAPAKPVRSGIFEERTSTLNALASGNMVGRTHELVDPVRCRMWAYHNRDYAALNHDRCVDLIDSIRAQGKQEQPAIVRRVTGDPDHDFEVIAGARRHWAVSWLRANNYPDFRYLIDIRELSDEEAFRISDLENRAREDLSDFERARDYLGALERYYGGHQQKMAERLNVTPAWLSRYLDIARLPEEVIAAFDSPHDLRIKHVTQLKPVLKPADVKAKAIAAAKTITSERQASGRPMIAADVVKRLVKAGRGGGSSGLSDRPRTGALHETVSGGSGKAAFTVSRAGKTAGLVFTLLPASGVSRDEVVAAFDHYLNEHWKEWT
jgi:ParB family transcriptional regulator, chromosome partitioning protein